MVGLDELYAVVGLEPSEFSADVEVKDLTQDSRELEEGWMFACVVGERADGHEFAAQAKEAGAVALLVERDVAVRLPQIRVTDVRASMAAISAAIHGYPSKDLRLVGVTGTSGKTTVTTILGQLLSLLGEPSKVIGTLGGERTTPESPRLQRQLARWRDEGIGTVAIEVSSHALLQNRVDALTFDVAVFMNLSPEHLDYHPSMQEYFEAKSKLFIEERSEQNLICIDDIWGQRLAELVGPSCVRFGIEDISGLEITVEGSRFRWREQLVELGIPGAFNVANGLAAAETALLLGYEPVSIAQALASVRPVRGRMEPVDLGQPFRVVIDYAHKPAALEAVLAEAADLAEGKLLVVFGCGGDRDTQKRPEMGNIASEIADHVIITSDNPRSESPEAIISEIIAGIPQVNSHKVTVIADRAQAIASALHGAEAGDIVVIAGKGHESTQIIGDRVLEFDDRLVAQSLLRELLEESH